THNGYGPNRFVRTALEEKAIKLFGQGEEKRDHLYIRDLSRLIGVCVLHRSAGVLNAATGISMSFREVADTIIACGTDVRLDCLPRTTPITHRHFDVATTLRARQTTLFTPHCVGLMAMMTTFAPKTLTAQPLAA